MEFAEYRQYSPGDEIKHIDWKVFGKTDRYYIKQFEEETNLACYIILDASGSMGYGSHETEKGDSPHLPERPGGCFAQMGTVPFFRRSKLRYGACMAACLAYFMLRQRDATGLMVFDSEVRTVLPPRGRQSHLKHMLSELDAIKPGGETNIARPLHDLAEGMSRRGLIVLISDLIDDPAAVLSALQHFKFRGHDVIVFHLMDNAELTFPFDSLTEFSDLETGQKAMVTPEGIRAVYMEQLRQFLTRLREGLRRHSRRLQAVQHDQAPRPGALRVSVPQEPNGMIGEPIDG